MNATSNEAYWSAKMRLNSVLLAIWFVVSFGCGILLVDVLNSVRIGGFELGFWFAQQGAIYVFLVLTFVYARQASRIDKKFNVSEDA